jgi:SAM-dependent methyltransferase
MNPEKLDAFRELLACPSCAGALSKEWACRACGARFDAPDGIPNLRLACDERTDTVRRFYQHAPFPGYPPRDTLYALRARAERNAFAQLLDRAIAGDADLTRASLLVGAAAARRFALDRVQFVETDLHRPGLKSCAFDVVYSSGVLHHTPNPRRSFARLAKLARGGGIIVVGVYNAFARLPSRARKLVARLSGFRLIPFDPVLRARRSEPARREAWLRDQYRHPEEHCHTIGEVQRWFAENDVEYLRAYPSAVLGDEPEHLFSAAADNWSVENWLAQLGWMRTLGREGGLFFSIGRRR